LVDILNKRCYNYILNSERRQMAGKAKSIYLTVTTMEHKSVFHRMFFNAKEFNDFVGTDKFKTTYPTTEYKIVKETY
jgi:hypothetical protein